MDNKLSELSKPVAWTWHAFGRQHITTEESDHEDLIADGDETHPLYSQEYVSALLAENEEKEKLLISNAIEYEISATDLLAELEAKDKRIAELERDRDTWQAGTLAMRDSWREERAELEAKLATPVRLPAREFDDGSDKQVCILAGRFNSGIDKSAEAIRAAGFTVEGDE